VTIDAPARPADSSRWRDFNELVKSRLNLLVILTTLFGFHIASRGRIDWPLLAFTLIGTALTAAGASVFNQLSERALDAKMPRTAGRPLVTGAWSPRSAIALGSGVSLVGVLLLAAFVNPLTAALGLSTLLLYVFVYTPLKRLTVRNTLVGAVPGAIPPLMGYAAVAGRIDVAAATLFAILFAWQMPHFYAIAIMYRDDYARAGFRMLPVGDAGLLKTRFAIATWCAALLLISVVPRVLGIAGDGYLAAAVLLGTLFGGCSLQLASTGTRRDARLVFFASIAYLPLLLAALAMNKQVPS
jgi:heme o synthase